MYQGVLCDVTERCVRCVVERNERERSWAARRTALMNPAKRVVLCGTMTPIAATTFPRGPEWLSSDVQGPLVLDCKVNPTVRAERLHEAFVEH